MLSQSGNNSGINGGNQEQMHLLNQLRSLKGNQQSMNSQRYAQNLNAQINALGISGGYGGSGQQLRELQLMLSNQVSGNQSGVLGQNGQQKGSPGNQSN